MGGVAGYGGGGFVPGEVAVTGQGGYDWTGRFVGNGYGAYGMGGRGWGRRPVKPPKGKPGRYPGTGLLGCLGI